MRCRTAGLWGCIGAEMIPGMTATGFREESPIDDDEKHFELPRQVGSRIDHGSLARKCTGSTKTVWYRLVDYRLPQSGGTILL